MSEWVSGSVSDLEIAIVSPSFASFVNSSSCVTNIIVIDVYGKANKSREPSNDVKWFSYLVTLFGRITLLTVCLAFTIPLPVNVKRMMKI